MKRALKIIIPIIIIVGLLIGISILKRVNNQLSKVPENDPYEVGNLAGNLYNNGYFAEKDGKVFFANPYDNYRLYSMNSDQTDMQFVANGNVSDINILGNYVYYYSSTAGDQSGLGYVRGGRGIYRTDASGKNTFSMAKVSSDGMVCIGNNVFFTSFNNSDSKGNAEISVERTSTNNEKQSTLLNEHIVLGSAYNGKIYYGGVKADHHLYTYDTIADSFSMLSDESVYLPIVYSGEVYYLDLNDTYHLKALSLSDGSIRTVVNERIDTYNLYNGIIYYQNCDPDNYALKRIYTDGSGNEVVASGVYRDINITGTYVYFREFGNDLPVYQQSTNGTINITTFDRARDIALENMK